MSNELQVQNDTPIALLRLAIEKDLDVDKLKQILDLKKEYELDEARKAYCDAKAKFKTEPILVFKDKTNKQYDSKYASKGSLVNTVNPILSKYGLNASWSFDQQDTRISVSCKLSHSQGYSETVTLSGPPDSSGSKNPLQQIKSTVTYLEIATFEAVTGVAASDDGDDDGNEGGKHVPVISENQVADLTAILDEIKDREGAKQAALKYAKVSELHEIPAAAFGQVVKGLEKRRKAG